VCRHPLEWDKGLYTANNVIDPQIRTRFGIPNTREHNEHFIRQVNAVDIWGELKDKRIEGLDLSRNSFWYAHPVYLVDFLDKAGWLTVPRIRDLMKIQNEAVALRCLAKGTGWGIYPEMWGKGRPEPVQTYCNHAVYITIKAVDGNIVNFTDRANGSFPELPKGMEYDYRKSNYWCDILKEQEEKHLIVKLSGEDEAKFYADMGYVVIGAWKTPDSNKNGSPHFATVRPGYEKDPDGGIMLANVGDSNGIMRRSEGFYNKLSTEIFWYYNPKQDFRYDSGTALFFLDYD
jgi:hypothetical protein